MQEPQYYQSNPFNQTPNSPQYPPQQPPQPVYEGQQQA